MKKLYYVICGEYRKFEKPNISYLLEKALVLSIICSKCKNEDEESIEILKILNFNWKYVIAFEMWLKKT